MTVVAIVQARMGSTRLPGKTLADVEGRPLLLRVVGRLKRCREIGKIVVATTSAQDDAPVAELAGKAGIACYAGSPEDVLDRYYQAAKKFGATVVVRVTGDCPLIDPALVDEVIHQFRAGRYDYFSNVRPPTYPDGLDVEVFTFAALERAWREARLASEREHVTPYIWKNRDRFRAGNLAYKEDLSQMRWCVDEEADLEFVRQVYRGLAGKEDFGMEDVLGLLARKPELMDINAGIARNEGYAKSLKEDERHGAKAERKKIA